MKNKNRKVFTVNKKRILMGALLPVFSFSVGCAHYPVNQPIKEVRLDAGYRAATMKTPDNKRDADGKGPQSGLHRGER